MGEVEIPDGIELRNFEVDDVETVAELVSMCPPLDVHTEFTYWVLASYFSNLCFVAESREGIEGFVSAVSNRGRCYLWQICVAPPLRGGPLGESLINAVVDEASHSGCRLLQVSIDPGNAPSTGLFSRVAARRGYEMKEVGHVGREIIYQWDLAGGRSGPDGVVFSGYFPGAAGMILAAHGTYYHEAWGFDSSFETQEGVELCEFMARFTGERDFLRVARLGEVFAGSIAVDGAGGGQYGARLRWFIVPPRLRGRGIGGRLIADAMEFCRHAGYGRVHLWTFEGLEAARHLYEKAGFRLAAERRVEQWGREVLNEQMFLFGGDHA